MTSVDDSAWRRPSGDASACDDGESQPPVPASGPPADSRYTGPPRNTPPPPGWRPEFVVQPPPPRALPAQDHSALDAQEASARTVTYGVGLVAGAILLVALLVLCGRAWF